MFGGLMKTLANVLTWFFVVTPWEQAIRVRGGSSVSVLNQGIYVRIPFYDRIYKQSVRRRVNLSKTQTLTTRDGKILTIACGLGYSICDIGKMYNTLEQPNDTVENELAGVVAEYVGDRNLRECTMQGIRKYVMEKMDVGRYGMTDKEFYVLSFATTKTYRLITGDIASWSRDCGVSMHEIGEVDRAR